MSYGYTLSPSSWLPLPCGGRALRHDATYEPALSWTPERKSRKATLTSKTALVSVADAEAKMRTGELPLPQLSPSERKRHCDQFNPSALPSERRSAAVLAGARRGSEAQRVKHEAAVLHAMATNLTLHRQGSYTVVTGAVERHNEKPSFRVRCDCGADSWVECGQWVRRASAKSCAKCASSRKGKTRAKREARAA
jgi:hypothetical protein